MVEHGIEDAILSIELGQSGSSVWMRRATYSPRKWKRLPVEDDEQQQQHPRCSAWARQKRLHQGRPVDAPGSVTHRSDGHGNDGDGQGEPANPGGRHGSLVMASPHVPFARIRIWCCLGLRRAHRVRDRVTLRLPKGGAGHFGGSGSSNALTVHPAAISELLKRATRYKKQIPRSSV